jgi:FtsP/CotA-like multicopper oxidase with cupredoxin domain
MTVEAAEVTVADLFSYNSRVFCVNSICKAPGPSLFARAGDEVKITLINTLEAGTANTTNLYIRGLHLERTHSESPSGIVSTDNPYPANSMRGVTGSAEGGNEITYSFKIPHDHAPGMHWYHSNVADDTYGDSSAGSTTNGTAALHMMNGLVGAFHVLPEDDQVLPSRLVTMDRVELVMTHVMLAQNDRDSSQLSAVENAADTSFTRAWTLSELEAAAGSALYTDVTYLNGSSYYAVNDSSVRLLRDVWLVNGQHQPEIALQPGDWKVFNILAASGDRLLELEIRDDAGAEAGNRACEMWLFAMDGVYLDSPRYADSTNHLILLPGSRASVGIHCPTSGTYYLQSASTTSTTSYYSSVGTYDSKSAQVLAMINVAGTFIWDQEGGGNVSLSSITRPTYLTSLIDINGTDVVADGASWSVALDSAGADVSTVGSPYLGGTLGAYNQLGDDTSSYWVGTGTDCTVPCFTNRDCSAFFGSDYTVADFYSVRQGHCTFGRGRKSISGDNPEANSPFSYTRDSAVDVRVWGRYPRSYALSFSEFHAQLISYTAASAGPETISASMKQTSATYTSGTNNTLLSLYGEPGDWRDTFPALPGLLTLRTKLHLPAQQPGELLGTYTAKSSLHCNFLKYEDHGLIERFIIDTSNDTYSFTVTTTTAVGDSMNDTSTSTRSEVVYDATASVVSGSGEDGFADKAAFDVLLRSTSPIELDAAVDAYRCDTHGSSWAYSEVIDTDRRVRVLTFNGCPNHFSVCQDAECAGPNASRAIRHPNVITVPLYPAFRTVRRDATCTRDAVGVALNGVPIHGRADSVGTETCVAKNGANNASIAPHDVFTACDYRGNGAVNDGALYCGNEIPERAGSMDKCAGYADEYGSYRYLVAPACLLNQLSSQQSAAAAVATPGNTPGAFGNTLQYQGKVIATGAGATAASPSPQVGWALDGFPIYGPVGTRGVSMVRCGDPGAHATICLDMCNGYYGTIDEDNFMYRYYMSGERGTGACSNVTTYANPAAGGYTACPRVDDQCCVSTVPNPRYTPYSIGCFMGCKYNETSCRFTGERGVQPSYNPTADLPLAPSGIYLASPEEEAAIAESVAAAEEAVGALSAVQEQQQSLEAIYYAQQSAQAARGLSTRPKNVVQLPFSGVLALVETPHNSVNLTNLDTSDDSISVETLPAANTDLLINNIVADQHTIGSDALLYMASSTGIHQLVEGQGYLTNLIGGYLKIGITGLNFGTSIASVTTLNVGGNACDNIIWFNNTYITCVLSREGTTSASSYTENDVVLTIANAGTANGVYLEPMTIFKSNSGRPAISAVTFTERAFRPLAVAALSRSVPRMPATVQGSTYATTTTTTSDCGHYFATNTLNNRQNYTNCEIEACGGDVVTASLCTSKGAQCTGDTMLSLYNKMYTVCDGVHDCPAYTYNNSKVVENDGFCGSCAQVTYKVPVYDNKPACSTLYLRQGCKGSAECDGVAIVSVEHTTWNLAANLTTDDYENGTRRMLYWSDNARGGYGIFRCWMHVTNDGTPNWCSQPELMLSGVQRARGLQAVPVGCGVATDGSLTVEDEGETTNQCDLVIYADGTTGGMYRALFPAMVPGSVYDADASATTYSYDSLDDAHGVSVQLATGLRGPVALTVDVAYMSSSHNERTDSRLFVSLLEGKLLRFDMTMVLGATAALPAVIDATTFGYNEYRNLGIVTVLDAPSKARFGGLCAVPALAEASGASNIATWKQHRVFVVDSNLNYVYASTEWKSGARPDLTLDVNTAYSTASAILMPVSVTTRASVASSTSVDLYIAEYLGKIWKVTVALDDSTGEVDLTSFRQSSPVNLLDHSVFTASIRIREEAEVAKSAGNPIYQRVFFEAMQ